MQAIEVKSVTKAYGEVTALRDVTVSLGKTGFTACLAATGRGNQRC